MPNKRALFIYLFIFLIIGIEETYSQCSMCRAVLQSEEGQATAKGINNGILYLMAIPYILVGIVGWKVFQILKKIISITNILE
jgi:hypothetical protein